MNTRIPHTIPLIAGILLLYLAATINTGCKPSLRTCQTLYPLDFIKVNCKDTVIITKKDTTLLTLPIKYLSDTFVKFVDREKLKIEIRKVNDYIQVKGECTPETIRIQVADTNLLKQKYKELQEERNLNKKEKGISTAEWIVFGLLAILGMIAGWTLGSYKNKTN